MEQLQRRISPEIYEALIQANINSLSAILLYDKNELIHITHLESNVVAQIVKETAKIILENKLCTAKQIPPWQKIKTGCSSIDKLLQGGIPTSGITEIVGCSGVGKTQFCLSLALMVQLPVAVGGLGKVAAYICTEDVFPVKRLNEMAQLFEDKYQTSFRFMDNVFIQHIAEFRQFKRCLTISIPALLSVKQVGIIIVDSIAGMFRSENSEVNYSSRGQDFVTIATQLTKLSRKYNLAVLCTNQVTDNIESGGTDPCLGLAWSNLITHRLSITRNVGSSGIREMELVFAPDLADDTCRFKIQGHGLVEV